MNTAKNHIPKESKLAFLQYLPFLFILFYIVAIIIFLGRIPRPEDLLNVISELYARYGSLLVFFAAFIEAIFLLGLYFPGSTMILFGAALSATGVVQFPMIIFFATLGLMLGYILNYILGRYGWYHVLAKFGFEESISQAGAKLKKHGGKAIFAGYFFPNGAAFLSTAAGVIKMPFWQFLLYSIFAQSFWSILWGTVAYFLGVLFVEYFMQYFFYIIWSIIALWIARKLWKKKFSKNVSP